MAVLVNIEVKTLDVLEWEQEFSDEQHEYHEKLIETFKDKLENYLKYNVNGFHQINASFSFNPVTLRFALLECKYPFKFQIENALNGVLKKYV